jgi:DDE superfamily endonuclease
MGIINEMKKSYRSILVRKIIDRLDKQEDPKIDILEAILILSSAWDKVKEKTIENCYFHSKITEKPNTDETEDMYPEELDDEVLGQCSEQISWDGGTVDDYLAVDNQVKSSVFVF